MDVLVVDAMRGDGQIADFGQMNHLQPPDDVSEDRGVGLGERCDSATSDKMQPPSSTHSHFTSASSAEGNLERICILARFPLG